MQKQSCGRKYVSDDTREVPSELSRFRGNDSQLDYRFGEAGWNILIPAFAVMAIIYSFYLQKMCQYRHKGLE
ncbi:MAG: hypothetical protein M1412_02335 [Deltaproteobacteria bacterium]|nr:hypothetical protein [Deltaproteobacteria bacterium]MCL5891993.1 hypothetical protein [Deltaproteobacteria bacterium]